MNRIFFSLSILLCLSFSSFSQKASLEGYVFESGNRGFLNNIELTVKQIRNDSLIGVVLSNEEGYFSIPLPLGEKFIIEANHDYFHTGQKEVHTLGSEDGAKVFAKLELNRAPGYLFDITIAESRESEDIVVDAIKSSSIEVYNNTKKEMVLHLVDYLQPDFKVHLKKGNHYTIMIRKENYITKRMEAFVDVKGCILCFEGIGDVRPGVTDNLTEKNSFGTLLANVEMERAMMKLISIPIIARSISFGTLLANVEMERAMMGMEISFLNKIYYERGSAKLSEGAKTELEKLKMFLSDNPNLIIELGSHTDSRGDSEKNRRLSFMRAQGAVDYILDGGLIDGSRLLARGYGSSKLANKCAPGVECTEEEHSVNRRTELKVLGYVKDYVSRSLASMKQEEFMDELLAEIEAEGQVKIPENGGAAIPSPVTGMEQGNNLESNNIDSDASEMDQESTSVKEAVNSVVSEIEHNISGAARDTDSSAPMMNSEDRDKVMPVEEEKVFPIMDDELEADMEITTKIDDVALSNDVEEIPVEEERGANDDASDPTAWMAGYKIVLLESKTELSGGHAIFNKFNDLNVLQSPVSKKYMYIFGDFSSELEAQNYINEKLKSSYPEAYLISF